MNWNQPICDPCWTETQPGREATRMNMGYRVEERCAWCGHVTTSGIYVRKHPDEVKFPASDDE